MAKARVKKAGWAQGRADKIDHEAAREVVIRRSLKSAAERAVTSALCTEAIDRIMANWYLILPSREVKTQKHYSGNVPVRTFSAGSIDGDGVSYGTGFPTSAAREDIAGLTVQRRHGATGNPVGRPPGLPQPGPREEKQIHNRLVWNRVKRTQPREIDDPAWQILKLRYGLDKDIPEIAEELRITEVAARQRLSRATRLARDLGMDFK